MSMSLDEYVSYVDVGGLYVLDEYEVEILSFQRDTSIGILTVVSVRIRLIL
jgi:hypothetical protein